MQLHTLREPYDEAICAYLIESLDEHGFLSGSVSTYCEDLQIDEETLLSQLRILQSFEPCGIAARSIREALILQCRKTRNTMGEQILSEYAQELVEGDLAAIAGGMQLSVREVKEAIASLCSVRKRTRGDDIARGRKLCTGPAASNRTHALWRYACAGAVCAGNRTN